MTKFNALYEKIIQGTTAFKHIVKYTFPDTIPDAKCDEIVSFLETNPDLASVINNLEHTKLTDPQWKSFWVSVKQSAAKQGKLTDITEDEWNTISSYFVNRLWGARLKDGEEAFNNDKATSSTYLQRYDNAIKTKQPQDQISFTASQMQPKDFSLARNPAAIGGSR